MNTKPLTEDIKFAGKVKELKHFLVAYELLLDIPEPPKDKHLQLPRG